MNLAVVDKEADRSYVEVGEADPIQEENLLEFRLLYQGELLPSGNRKTRPKEKHAIRRHLHLQLRRLWHVERNLRWLAVHSCTTPPPKIPPLLPIGQMAEQEKIEFGIAAIGSRWSMFGYNFVPLITTEHAVRCSIEVLLLRPEERQFICKQGDIDGQVKTLFDALRLPRSPNEAGEGPQQDETPFFVLLEDDNLISEVRVSTDQLLLLPEQRTLKANDAFAVIHVRLNYRSGRSLDAIF